MSEKRFSRFCLLCISVLGLASCGGKGSNGGEDALPKVEFTAIDTSKSEVQTLKIGMECNYSPFNWTAPSADGNTLKIANAGGYADGYDIQIARLLGQALKMDVEIYAEEWDSLIPDLQNDSINMVIAGMTDTEERRQSISFTNEYYHSEVVLLAPDTVASSYSGRTLGEADLSSLLKGKNVVSQKNTVEDDMIDSFVKDYSCSHAAAQDTYGLAALDVKNGTADFLVVERPVAEAYVSQMKNVGIIALDQDVISSFQSELGVSIGVKKENRELINILNSALSQISTDVRNEIMTGAVQRSAE